MDAKRSSICFGFLVTVMHSMQAGYMDKAQKYTDKALTQIEKLKSKYALHLLFPCINFSFVFNALLKKLKIFIILQLSIINLSCLCFH